MVLLDSLFSSRFVSGLAKHACIVTEWLQSLGNDSCEIRMSGIDQAVVFVRYEDGRHKQKAPLAAAYERVTIPCEFGRGGRIPSVGGEVADTDLFPGHLVGDVYDG
jgi:hypothetical protein